MKKARLVVSALTLSFVALLFSAVATNDVSADLNCTRIKNCGGDAGCASGSLAGCTITCTSGVIIECGQG